jgi:hypothetical protein
VVIAVFLFRLVNRKKCAILRKQCELYVNNCKSMIFLGFELLWNMGNLCKSVEFAPKKCGIQQF